MTEKIEAMRKAARELLEEGKVDMIIGYEKGSMPLRSSPCFITDPKDVDRFNWGPSCGINLAKYLKGKDGKIGIIAKGCDSRSVVLLISENQINEENITVIGLPCEGVINRKKIEDTLGGKEITEAVIEGDKIHLKGRDFEKSLPLEEYLSDSCKYCKHPNPVIHDVLIGEPVSEKQIESYPDVEELDAMTPEERYSFFVNELGDCIRCYSCRNVCPSCYCKECFVDATMPQWFGKTTDLSDTMIFHIVRSLHMAGRCVDCGACTRACPMGINLRYLLSVAEKVIKDRFDYEAGVDMKQSPVMGIYDKEDSDDFIR
ncbi:MAG: 4Fe-4S dicluster domain-containing protein [Candidatus Bathyarchaeota archaeon]